MRRNRNLIKYGLLVSILLLAVVFLIVKFRKESYGTYSSVEFISEIDYSPDRSFLYNNSDRLYVCTENGTKAYDGTGGLCTDVVYGYDNPCVVSCGATSAVADIGGTNVVVIASNGIPYFYETDYEIVRICVAENGKTAVLLDNGDYDLIRIYSTEGKALVEIGTQTVKEGIPVDIALSPDGEKLVTLYLSFDGDNIVSKVTFYNTGDVGDNYIENIVGQRIFEDEAVYFVRFLGNNNVGIGLHNGFMLYSMKQIPSLLKEERFEDTLADMVMQDDTIATILEKDSQRTMILWSPQGDKLAAYDVSLSALIHVSNGEAIVSDGSLVCIYRTNGTTKTVLQFQDTVDDVLFAGGTHYYVIGSGKIRVINLTD